MLHVWCRGLIPKRRLIDDGLCGANEDDDENNSLQKSDPYLGLVSLGNDFAWAYQVSANNFADAKANIHTDFSAIYGTIISTDSGAFFLSYD